MARPEHTRQLARLLGSAAEVVEAPVDDLWARDTLPCFLTPKGGASDGRSDGARDRGAPGATAGDPGVGGGDTVAPLVAGLLRFNGWGGKQRHRGDARLARLVAARLDVPVLDSGLTGEGGGLEVDGAGSLMAARSSWVDGDRNPGLDEDQVGQVLLDLVGADHLVWVDGLAGEDITDGHIDAAARFVAPGVVALDTPPATAPASVWTDLAERTRAELLEARGRGGERLDLVPVVQPATTRASSPDVLASYVNYCVCNGAVVVPAFGDPVADERAAGVLGDLHPGREVVSLDIDALAAGGGGIHCATQQQPATAA